jgi:hypothetical protein
MKTKIKIIIIGLLVLGICGVAVRQSYAYYVTTLDYTVGDYASQFDCSVEKTGDYSMFGYNTVKYTIYNNSSLYAADEIPFNYTLTIENEDNSDDLLFGYNHVFSDRLTFTGTLDADSNSSSVEYVVQFKAKNNGDYDHDFNYKYTLECKQAY